MDNPTIDIVIATYNGKDYLPIQLLSIIGQTYKNWRVLIHDDGSSDGTQNIIKEFCRQDERIKWIDDGEIFHSPAKNFMHLLKFTSAPFICFCDQDDIWIENKLSVLLAHATKTPTPSAIISSGYLFQTETNCITGLINYSINNLKELLFVNGGVHGSRCMINYSMKEKMLEYVGPLNMHDHLMTQIACSFGEIKYIDIPLFFYRQHSSNVTGNVTTSRIKRLIEGFSSLKDKFLISREVYQCNSTFFSNFKDQLSPSDQKLIQEYLNIQNKTYLGRLLLIIKGRYSLCSNSKLHLIIKAATRSLFDS